MIGGFIDSPLLPGLGRLVIEGRADRGTYWRSSVDFAQIALLFAGWVVAFMLGKELQSGLAQWQQSRRRR